MTWGELTQALAGWLNLPEAEPAIPTFIQLAEAEIARALADAGVGCTLLRVRASLAAEWCGAPGDMLRPLDLAFVDCGDRVTNVTREGFEAAKASMPARGRPQVYAVVGSELHLWPAPDRTYTAELTYLTRLPPLTQGSPTNAISQAWPGVYLYGALAHAASFLGDEARAAACQARFDTLLAGMVDTERARLGVRATPAFRASDLSSLVGQDHAL